MNDVLTAAILQARADGDAAAAVELTALADQPELLAVLLAELQAAD